MVRNSRISPRTRERQSREEVGAAFDASCVQRQISQHHPTDGDDQKLARARVLSVRRTEARSTSATARTKVDASAWV